MNKNNFWMHFGIAAVAIFAAALAGVVIRSIDSFEQEEAKVVKKPMTFSRDAKASEPELMVRFKPGVSIAQIRKLVGLKNDRIEDKFENINNWVAIDDLDDASAEELVREYKNMSDLVLFAEANHRI